MRVLMRRLVLACLRSPCHQSVLCAHKERRVNCCHLQLYAGDDVGDTRCDVLLAQAIPAVIPFNSIRLAHTRTRQNAGILPSCQFSTCRPGSRGWARFTTIARAGTNPCVAFASA